MLKPGFYSINIIIYAKEYATSGRNIVFKMDEPDTNCNADRTMWFYLIMATTIITASGHPGTLLGPLSTLQM